MMIPVSQAQKLRRREFIICSRSQLARNRARVQTQSHQELRWAHLHCKGGPHPKCELERRRGLALFGECLGWEGLMSREGNSAGICDNQNHKYFLRTYEVQGTTRFGIAVGSKDATQR